MGYLIILRGVNILREKAKDQAKKNLKKDFGIAIVVMFLYSAVINFLSSFGIGTLLFSSAVLTGYHLFNIKLMKDKVADLNIIVEGFTKQDISRVIIISILVNIFRFLWSLLFIIPGIVKTYSYTLTEYIAINDNKLTASECITLSREIMNGHKWELFMFDLSFILWYFAIFFSCGLAILYVGPYQAQARTVYIHNNIYKLYIYKEPVLVEPTIL